MYGVYARQPISKGELLTIWGGDVVDYATFCTLDPYLRELSIQIEDDFFLAPLTLGPSDYFNHSCDPNAGLSGQISLVALRDIAPGEEVRFDYAMSDSTDYDEFDCDCGADNCRGRFTGRDWQIPDLWERYDRHFSPYLLRKIEQLKQEQRRPS
jgi:hypothetical protein